MSQRISLSVVKAAIPKERDYFLWDRDLKGFGLKVCSGGRKSYVCKYRYGHGRKAPTRRVTIGAHGSPWTPDTARKEASRILGLVTQGHDPARAKQLANEVPTVAEVCDFYLERGVATKKSSTIATDKGRIERHIKPLLGHMRITEVSRACVAKFLQDVASGKTAVDVRTRKRGRAIVTGGKGTATRTVGLLGGIFSYAIEEGWLSENPVKGVKRYRDRKNERFLSPKEFQRLGAELSIALARGENPSAVSIIRLLILTGARKGEIEQLKWAEVDSVSGFIRLADSKTGQKLIVLSALAKQVLSGIERGSVGDFVFPGADGQGWYQGTPKVWRRIRRLANLQDVRLHDLRHSFASVAAADGASLQMIGALLGHKSTATTARYAHLSDAPVRQAAESASTQLQQLLGE
jgi:integrase